MRLLLLLSCWVLGCGTVIDQPEPADGGGRDAPATMEADAALRVEGQHQLSLLFEERAVFMVRYVDAHGAAIPFAPVTFALEGRANDSGLSEIEATTDEEGLAAGTVMAGRASAVFRIRVAAERALPAYIDVAVSDAGFGALSIDAQYEGERSVHEWAFYAFAGATCVEDRVTLGAADRVSRASADSASFVALPATVRYAVAARGLGALGETLAYGCVETEPLVADHNMAVRIPVADLPLMIAGEYDTEIRFTSSEHAALLGDTVRREGLASVDESGSDAAFLLDTLESVLRARGDEDVADRLVDARESGALEVGLDARLAEAETGPTRAIERLAIELERRSASVRIESLVTLQNRAGGSLHITELSTNTADLSGLRLVVDLDRVVVPLEGAVEARAVKGADRVRLESIVIPLPLGQLGKGVILAMVAETDGSNLEDLLGSTGGCDALVASMSEVTTVYDTCGERCVLAACGAAMSRLATRIKDSIAALDDERSFLRFAGELLVEDLTGDARVNRAHAPFLDGSWISVTGARRTPVEATLEAARIEGPE